MERAARIAVRETKIFLERNRSVKQVALVCFGTGALAIHQAVLEKAGKL
jgi:O-acetyl-ADP-ribose deacetylase (regulator of RNase III)